MKLLNIYIKSVNKINEKVQLVFPIEDEPKFIEYSPRESVHKGYWKFKISQELIKNFRHVDFFEDSYTAGFPLDSIRIIFEGDNSIDFYEHTFWIGKDFINISPGKNIPQCDLNNFKKFTFF